ncbi:unnamed protein product, partial [Iphiclides podalirius]
MAGMASRIRSRPLDRNANTLPDKSARTIERYGGGERYVSTYIYRGTNNIPWGADKSFRCSRLIDSSIRRICIGIILWALRGVLAVASINRRACGLPLFYVPTRELNEADPGRSEQTRADPNCFVPVRTDLPPANSRKSAASP